MDSETARQLQALFARHYEAFLREADALFDTPENRQRIQVALEPFRQQQQKAIGLGAAIAEHWEPFLPKLLAMCKSEQTKQRLLETFTRTLTEQIDALSTVLAEQHLSPGGQ